MMLLFHAVMSLIEKSSGFEAHTYAHHFPIWSQHFDGLFQRDIGP
jgi:predicted oxidoreductase (fatty acid repression mutant protein)